MRKKDPCFCPPFTPMVKLLTPDECGDYALERLVLTAKEVKFEQMMDGLKGRYIESAYLEAGEYIRLMSGKHLLMSDTGMERFFNWEFIRRARGEVLVAGLGLGMVLPPLLSKGEVTRVVVVERKPEVIELVIGQLARTLRGDVEIVQADIHDYQPEGKFNTIWLDIWEDVVADNLPEMKDLRQQFKHSLKRGGWMGAWRYDELAHPRR